MGHEAHVRAAERIKTGIIFVLIVLMLVLLLLLVLGQSTANAESMLPKDRMVVYTTGAKTGYAKGMASVHTVPAMLAYRTAQMSEQSISCLYAADSIDKPYSTLYALIRVLFGAESLCTELDAKTGEELWKACTNTDRFLYLRYQGALPPGVIRAYTYVEDDSALDGADLDEIPLGDTVYVREVFFLSKQDVALFLQNSGEAANEDAAEDLDEICAVTRDEEGHTALFRFQKNGKQKTNAAEQRVLQSANAAYAGNISDWDNAVNPGKKEAASVIGEDLSVYLEAVQNLSAADVQPAYFFGSFDDSCDSDRFHAPHKACSFTADDPTAVYYAGICRMPVLTLTPWNAETALYSSEKAAEALSLLGIHEGEDDHYYIDTLGGRVYLNEDGRLRIGEDGSGTVEYTALQGGGIPMNTYLGYASVGGSYLLSEYLRAADRLLSRLTDLDRAFGGGDMTVSLYSVRSARNSAMHTYQESSGIVLVYIYTMNGIPVMDEAGEVMTAMTLTASGGKVMHVTFHPCMGSVSGEYEYLLPQTVVWDAMQLETQKQQTDAQHVSDDAAGEDFDGSPRGAEDALQTFLRGSFVMRYLYCGSAVSKGEGEENTDEARFAAEWVWVSQSEHENANAERLEQERR